MVSGRTATLPALHEAGSLGTAPLRGEMIAADNTLLLAPNTLLQSSILLAQGNPLNPASLRGPTEPSSHIASSGTRGLWGRADPARLPLPHRGGTREAVQEVTTPQPGGTGGHGNVSNEKRHARGGLGSGG